MSLLSVPALIADAECATKLSDWGSSSFIEPLSIYLDSIKKQSALTPQGEQLVYRTLLRLLCNRLKIQRDLSIYREIQNVELPPLIFITGLPRTGTTLLHRLMATDVNARYLRLWEGMFPSPPPGASGSIDEERRKLAAAWVEGVSQIAPAMAAAHHFASNDPEECYLLHEHSFVDTIFELRTHVPEYSEYLVEHEAKSELYEEYKQILKLLSLHCAEKYWVLKAPRHLMGLSGLIKVLPNARIIHVHRDPNEAIASLCSLCEIDRRIYCNSIDRPEIGKFWLNRLANAVEQSLKIRDSDSYDRYIDVHYVNLLADPIATVKEIYARLGFVWSVQYEQAITDWLQLHPQNVHGRHQYQLSDYFLTSQNVNTRFENYRQRFLL